MTNQQHPQVRLVRCPKCAKVLPEPEHVPLYTCGGCGTILQVKNYRGHQRNTALTSHVQDVTRSNGNINGSRDGGESSGSSSSGEQSVVQDEGRNRVVEGSTNSVQNGAVTSLDSTLVSKESRFLKNKENEKIDNSKSDKSYGKSEQNKSDKSYCKSEQNESADSAEHTALSEESSFTDNKENGEKDNVFNQSDSRDRIDDFPIAFENKAPEQHIVACSGQEDEKGQDERCSGIVLENHHQQQTGDMNFDRETSTVLEDSQVLEKKILQQLSIEESTEDGDDQNQQKLKEYVKSTKEASSQSESPAKENPEEHHASDHEMPEEVRKMNLVEKRSDQNQHEQSQVKYSNTVKYASSRTDFPNIQKPAHFASERSSEHDASDEKVSRETRSIHPNQDNEVRYLSAHEPAGVEISGGEYGNGTDSKEQVEYANSAKEASSSIGSLDNKQQTQSLSENTADCDASDHEVSEETREMHLVEEQLHHVSEDENEIHYLHADEPEDVEKEGSENGNQTYPNDFVERTEEQFESVHAESLSTEATQGVNDDSVPGTDCSLKACGRDHVFIPSNVADLKTLHEVGTVNVSRDKCGSNSLDNVRESSKQNIENLGDSRVHIEKEVGSLMKEIPRSPSKRSPAYDGSVSSFDGNEDKVPEQPPQVGEETLSSTNAVAGYDSAEDSPEWNNVPLERRTIWNSRVQIPVKGSSSMIPNKLKSRMIEEEGPVEGNGFSQRHNIYRPNRESFLARVPNRRRSSEMTYETGSCSSYATYDEPPIHQMHHHPYRRRFPEAPLWREKEFLPMYYNSETSGEIYDRQNHHAYFDRRKRAESWSQSGTLPRMPYSGELFSGRSSYMRRYPDDRRWSAQLPPAAVYYHQGLHMGPSSWDTRWDPYDSYPTSPPQFMESDSSCAWDHDTLSLSDDPRHREQLMRGLYLREKRQAVKKQFYPMAGGTPFITCHVCFHILQLPQDFLLLSRRRRRRSHKLKCGACSSVLEFSLENEGGLAPCETTTNRNVNLAVANHSHQRSLNSADGKELLSQDSFRASGREKRKIITGSSSNREKMDGSHDAEPSARGRQPKVTWQLPARSKSPLHKLMGYSSPQELLTGHECDDVE